MKRSLAVVWIVLALATSVGASKLVQLTFGPAWTRAQWYSSKPTSWNAGIESGFLFDRKVGVGFEADFLWNTFSRDSSLGGGRYRTISVDKSFMFPLGGFVLVDPFPEWLIHPAVKLNIGYNSVVHNQTAHDNPDIQYFYGLIIKAGADALYSFGDVGSVFLGAEYQWANTRSALDKNGGFTHHDMSGVGIHLGFRASL